MYNETPGLVYSTVKTNKIMSVIKAVKYLANDLKKIAANKEPRLLPLIEAVASIDEPQHQNALDKWEKQVMELELPDKEKLQNNPIYGASVAIFDLGRANMYCAFKEENAVQAFNDAVGKINILRATESKVPKFDLSCW